jgi:hypothetical protein
LPHSPFVEPVFLRLGKSRLVVHLLTMY